MRRYDTLRRGLVRSIVLLACWLAVAAPVSGGLPALVTVNVSAPRAPQAAPITESAGVVRTMAAPDIYLPLIIGSVPANPPDRQEALRLYREEYLTSEGTPMGWMGNHSGCQAGQTSQAFQNAVLRRINYFRTVAGVPTVTLRSEYNAKAQAAALMMSVNDDLDHSPPIGWLCYSSDGAEAAGNSNLALGMMGWDAVTAYMREGSPLGHRRWVLYPQTKQMGTGDVPRVGAFRASNALWVFDSNMWGPRPATREEFVAWPPPGYVPYPVINYTWSFSYAGADFSSATASMSSGGVNLPVTLQPVVNGYGENTLAWVPQGASGNWPQPAADTRYTVKVQNVIIGGQSRSFTYEVIVFDPGP